MTTLNYVSFQNTGDGELIAYSDLEVRIQEGGTVEKMGWKELVYHSPTPRGICAVLNAPAYYGVKRMLSHDAMLEKVFRIKQKVIASPEIHPVK